jgi:hypothetical protein
MHTETMNGCVIVGPSGIVIAMCIGQKMMLKRSDIETGVTYNMVAMVWKDRNVNILINLLFIPA